MDLEFPSSAQLPFPLRLSCRRLCLAVIMLAGGLPMLARADGFGPNILPAGGFDNATPTYVPWAGVDAQGNLHGIDGEQLAVGDAGDIRNYPFAPSMSVGDLNGDGKPDLVVADSYGFFWYYPNTGTPQSAAFTQAEVIPIWLAKSETDFLGEPGNNSVPRIQLIDPTSSNKLDIFAGTYTGMLYHIRNEGSATTPQFRPTQDLDLIKVNTRRQGVLWCNYLSPCFTNLFGAPNSFDLIMGEGTYSANSIYLLHNTGSGDSPTFDEDHIKKIIPGMGLEQLTPAVVDWNNDGKPDVICGDRKGDLMLYLNTSSDPSNPTFADGTKISIAGQDNFGGCITVAVGDLSGNHLPNLLIGKNDGTILYAVNTGKLGAPAFNTVPTPLKGVLPPEYKQYMQFSEWSKGGAWGDAYEMLCATNPQLEPGFTFPEGEKTKYAMRFYVWPYKSVYFPGRYKEVENDWSQHDIHCSEGVTLKLNTRYRVHLWIKSDGNVDNLHIKLGAADLERAGFNASDININLPSAPSWQEVNEDIEVEDRDDKTISEFYVDDLEIQEEK
jgi:hypothetical protein